MTHFCKPTDVVVLKTGEFFVSDGLVLLKRSVWKKITKILNSEGIQNGKSVIKWQNQKLKHIKLMYSNCHIPDLVQTFSNVENGGLNLVLYLA